MLTLLYIIAVGPIILAIAFLTIGFMCIALYKMRKFLCITALSGLAVWALFGLCKSISWEHFGTWFGLLVVGSVATVAAVRFINPTTEKVYNIQTLPEPMPVTTPDPLSDAAFRTWRAASAKKIV